MKQRHQHEDITETMSDIEVKRELCRLRKQRQETKRRTSMDIETDEDGHITWHPPTGELD